jgi:hypothetical protein
MNVTMEQETYKRHNPILHAPQTKSYFGLPMALSRCSIAFIKSDSSSFMVAEDVLVYRLGPYIVKCSHLQNRFPAAAVDTYSISAALWAPFLVLGVVPPKPFGIPNGNTCH